MWGLRVAGNARYREEVIQELLDRHWTNHGLHKLPPNGHQYRVMEVSVCGEEPLEVALWFDGSTWPDWVMVGMILRARTVHVIVNGPG